MKKKRVENGKFYYRFDIFGRVYKVKELGTMEDKYNFFVGNYFRTKKSTEKARRIHLNEESI